jgi:hypothetical protein
MSLAISYRNSMVICRDTKGLAEMRPRTEWIPEDAKKSPKLTPWGSCGDDETATFFIWFYLVLSILTLEEFK